MPGYGVACPPTLPLAWTTALGSLSLKLPLGLDPAWRARYSPAAYSESQGLRPSADTPAESFSTSQGERHHGTEARIRRGHDITYVHDARRLSSRQPFVRCH